MGPKKKERDTDHSSSSRGGNTNGRSDSLQADHELFLQAFESKYISFNPEMPYLFCMSFSQPKSTILNKLCDVFLKVNCLH